MKSKRHHQYNQEEFRVKNIATLDDFPQIKGYDFEKGIHLSDILESFATTGIQASNLAKAIAIIKTMRREKAKVCIAFTSNMITSGVREIITYLTKHKFIDVIVTAAGGIEEDIVKSIKPFVLGDFSADDSWLFDQGVNRTGNIFVPNDRYLHFERFITPLLKELYDKQQEDNTPTTVRALTKHLGRAIDNKESFLYWAQYNDIPVYCPAPTDGALGDMMYFMKQRHKDFYLDLTQDMFDLVNEGLQADKIGVVILGGGVAKHHLLNALIFREGADYAVYVNTGHEFDASDSGARVSEAVSWGKIKPNALSVKVAGDASIIFPLIVAGVLSEN